MDNIIKFPTTTEKEFVNGTKLAKEEFTRFKTTEENINWRLNFKDWNECTLTETEVEQVALYGQYMNFKPIVASRLAQKLSEMLCKIKYVDCYDE